MIERIKFFENKEKSEQDIKSNFKRQITSTDFTMKLLKFDPLIRNREKEEKKEQIIPKKLDMNRYPLNMNAQIKRANTVIEFKQMNKINIEKHMSNMKEEITKKIQYENPKILVKTISIEEYLQKLYSSNKKVTIIKRKIPKKLNTEEILNNMIENNKAKNTINEDFNENDFDNLYIRKRSHTVSDALLNMKKKEEEKKLIEEEKKKILEERKRREEERKRIEEERKRKEEEERKRREEEQRIQREKDRIKYEEEKEKRRKEEEERKRKEEEERKRREEEQRIQREKDKIKYEEEERKRRKKEEEERKRREEEERKRREEEEKKKKEEDEKLKIQILKKLNKKEEDFTEYEIKKLIENERYLKTIEDYNKIKYIEPNSDSEGKDIQFTFEEINQISTEPLENLEVTETGKIIALIRNYISKIIIYKENTYQEENCIILESKVNSISYKNNNIYCALDEPNDNILIISLDNYDDRIYLNGHNCSVTDITLTSYGYMISTDIKGTIVCWKNNEVKKKSYDFHNYINTITEVRESQQQIAILSFKEEKIKFYDLRYSTLDCIETIPDIKGSGHKYNMLKLNNNILAVAGTYIYIIELNTLILTNRINCIFANITISNFLFNQIGYFFVSQSNDFEKGTLGYYCYNINNWVLLEYNTLVKLASKSKCHDDFITSIKQIDSKTIVTGSYDGKIKFWNLKELNK